MTIKSKDSIINIIVGSGQYKKIERANNGTLILNIISAGNVNSKDTKPFSGKIVMILK